MELDTEKERVEFKQATGKHDLNEVAKYCVAIGNEGGGSYVLGVTNKKPRRAIGVSYRPDIDQDKITLFEWLGIKIEAHEIYAPDLVVSYVTRSRPKGRALHFRGTYYMRAGSSLRGMTWEELQKISNEGDADFTSNTIDGADLSVYDDRYIEIFREGWIKKQQDDPVSKKIPGWDKDELLENSGLTIDGKPTYAGLILVGNEKSLSKYLPASEIVFEYRNAEGAIGHVERRTFRYGFVGSADDIWKSVDRRNSTIDYSEGFFKYKSNAFHEDSVREAICNAVSHRDYRHDGSVFVRLSPTSIEVESPGSFPDGVNPTNILWKTVPRNRRLAEGMDRCGLVERSGQGMDLMFGYCVTHARPLPDLSQSDEHRVLIKLRSEITDPKIIAFFEQISAETLKGFSGLDFLAVDLVRRGETLPDHAAKRVPRLVALGILDKVKKRYVLSERLLAQIKASSAQADDHRLVSAQLQQNGAAGTSVGDLMKLLGKDREKVRWILEELRRDGVAIPRGQGRGAKWYLTKMGVSR
jgi:ATP-dependent DNA helicase RecG